MTSWLFAVAAIVAFTGDVRAQRAGERINPETIERSIENIRAMNLAELRDFSTYLSSCYSYPLFIERREKVICHERMFGYLIFWENDRSLDAIIREFFLLAALADSQRGSRQDRNRVPSVQSVIEIAERFSAVRELWRKAVASRNRALYETP